MRPAVPGATSRILFQVATTTSQAYNNWPERLGGKSLYDFNSSGQVRSPAVSLERPIEPFARFFDAYEVWFVRWLEKRGISAEYCTSVDLHKDPALLDAYQLFLSVGHDEYWSWEMRDTVEAFVNNGGNAAFFSGNTCWWQIRFDSRTAPRQLLCYKDGADPALSTNPSRATLNWFEPAGPNRPENRLTGLSYRAPGGATRTPPAGAPTPAAVDFVVRNAWPGCSRARGSATATPSARTSPATRWMPPDSRQSTMCPCASPDWTARRTASTSSPRRFMLSSNPSVGQGWTLSGVAFHAYPQAVTDPTHGATVTVYEYYRVQANGDGVRFFYSTQASVGQGWTLTGRGFHALPRS